MVVYIASYMGGCGRRTGSLRTAQAELVSAYLKNKTPAKGLRVLAHVVEYFPNIHKALGSIPSKAEYACAYVYVSMNVCVCINIYTYINDNNMQGLYIIYASTILLYANMLQNLK
jgi:hypothetical protein